MITRPLLPGLLTALAACAALATGCKRAPAWPPDPTPVVLGEDTCDACKMIISDIRFGAELQPRQGEAEQFDDLGCLVARHRGETLDLQGVFVRAFPTGAWIRGDRVWVLSAGDVRSPMGYGLAGFADEPSARTEAARHPGSSVASLEQTLSGRPLISKGER